MAAAPPSPAKTETERLPLMTHYVFGLFRRVPAAPSLSPEDADAIQESHLAHLRRLRESGELITAGPFMEDGDLRGILIFRTGSTVEARKAMESDPAVREGRLVLDLYTWFAPAGLEVAAEGSPGTNLSFEAD